MTKKKSSSAADDLIKSLMDDVSGDEEPQSAESPFLAGDEEAVPKTMNFPVGLDRAVGEEEKYDGPSLVATYQSNDDIFSDEPGNPAPKAEASPPKATPLAVVLNMADDKTMPLPSPMHSEYSGSNMPSQSSAPDRIVMSSPKANALPGMSHLDASLIQAENLKMAQQRILDLEQEVDRLRQENEEIASAAEIVKVRTEEANVRLHRVEREKDEAQENSNNEMMILKGQLQYKETEMAKAALKIEDLEIRLKNDFRKIRVRERELENRLELLRAEKTTLIRSKDDSILELKRKIDQLQHEMDGYREKCLELNKTLDAHKEQFKRTVRALKLALTNLEVRDENLEALKKAE